MLRGARRTVGHCSVLATRVLCFLGVFFLAGGLKNPPVESVRDKHAAHRNADPIGRREPDDYQHKVYIATDEVLSVSPESDDECLARFDKPLPHWRDAVETHSSEEDDMEREANDDPQASVEIPTYTEDDRKAARRAVNDALANSIGNMNLLAVPQVRMERFQGEVGPAVGHCKRGRPVVSLPYRYDPKLAYPLVVNLHSYDHDPRIMKDMWDFASAAIIEERDRNRNLHAIHLYPFGKTFRNDSAFRFWNGGRGACCDYPAVHMNRTTICGQDDVDYVWESMRAVTNKYKVKEDQVYAVGVSNGGVLAQSLACELSGIFTAVVGIAAPFWHRCKPVRRVPVLLVWGSDDSTMNPNGGRLNNPYSTVHTGSVGSLKAWSLVHRCQREEHDSMDLFPQDKIKGTVTRETPVTRYNCPPHGISELWEIMGWGHILIGTQKNDYGENLSMIRHILRWLFQFSNPPVGDGIGATRNAYGHGWNMKKCLAATALRPATVLK